MKYVLAFGLALSAVTAANADQRFYDSRGNHIGSTSRDSAGNQRYYDNRGRSTGSSSPVYGGRNYYDSQGRHTGSSYNR